MRFKKNHWYKWIGPKVRSQIWNNNGHMDFILDGKPWKCKEGNLGTASFENQPYDKNRMWCWFGCDENIIEVKVIDKNKNYMLEFN
jgi:hypothetical protein